MMFPQWLRNQTQIRALDLTNTGISGELPQWLWNTTALLWLQLSSNHLTGSFARHTVCDGCNLVVLDLHDNMLSGTIPPWLGHLETVAAVDLSGNILTGVVFEGGNSSSLLTGRNLFLLDLSDNMLSGKIQIENVYPGSFFQISSLRGNDFSGPISLQLCYFPHLIILELAHNHLTGRIPCCLGSIIFNMDYVGFNRKSGLEIQEIIKGTMQKFAETVGTHSLIDLSGNHLVGTIPEDLTKISKMMELNLSNHHLTGSFPADIGNLKLLESLDLSNNHLSGTIPQSLSTIPWLNRLNLSSNHLHGPIPIGNHLHGPIPIGNQLQTLDDPSIYAGNSDLCGFPLPGDCTKLAHSDATQMMILVLEQDDAEDKHEKLFYLVIMAGIATGFWGVVVTLALKKNWRNFYYRFVEETADKMYVLTKVG